MPGNYKQTLMLKSWSQEDMNQAMEAVGEDAMGWFMTSKRFNVPQAMLTSSLSAGSKNTNISLRAPQPTLGARAKAFDKLQVMRFFALLEKIVTDEEIPAHKELFLPSEVTENDIKMNAEEMNIAGVPANIAQNVEGPSLSPTILTGQDDI
ncbi:hypothetical protein ILUMI_17441 [Ignelater luminosus]|uniref:Uncharacterized protein n=1 Tax=Ignelater luminosus TaxID=2038154 RepID=A0A8K0G521_IGNLU|nr:hypothetical protein ILUMI_17441 [Ignelater luminosus]